MKTGLRIRGGSNPGYDFKRLHFCGVMWFLLCVIFLVVIATERMGFHWWIVFSVSGYSTVVALFLIAIYLFSIYKGVVRNLNSIEHPLTTSWYYILLYESAPFLGVLAGLSALSYRQPVLSWFIVVAQGTLIMTVVLWIMVDPLVGLIEAALPLSAAHRKRRLTKNHKKKRAQRHARQKLLDEIIQQQTQTESRWSGLFRPYAMEVADLLCSSSVGMDTIQRRVVELGALAWKEGEILSMELFHQIILDELKRRTNHPAIDFVTLYWDGIGTWRKPSQIERMYLKNT